MYYEMIDCLKDQTITLTPKSQATLGAFEGVEVDTYVGNNIDAVGSFLIDAEQSEFNDVLSLTAFTSSPMDTKQQVEHLNTYSDRVLTNFHKKVMEYNRELLVQMKNMDIPHVTDETTNLYDLTVTNKGEYGLSDLSVAIKVTDLDSYFRFDLNALSAEMSDVMGLFIVTLEKYGAFSIALERGHHNELYEMITYLSDEKKQTVFECAERFEKEQVTEQAFIDVLDAADSDIFETACDWHDEDSALLVVNKHSN